MPMLTKTTELDEYCKRARGHPFVALDTEFMGEKRYYPKLCLIQLATPELNSSGVLVDVLAKGMRLDSLKSLLTDRSVVKVFHSGRQDIEILYNALNHIPQPVFDTQIAAMVCGFGNSVAYATLVRKLASARIDKSSRFTDWSKRPLSVQQMDYAMSDVTYLRTVYLKLREMLDSQGRADWIEDEVKSLTDPESLRIDVDKAWRRIKLSRVPKGALPVIKELARLREQLAQRLNIPRNFLIADSGLVALASLQPDSIRQLRRLRFGGNSQFVRRFGPEVLEAVASGQRQIGSKEVSQRLPQMPSPSKDATHMLRLLRKIVAKKNGVAENMLATQSDLKAIAVGDLSARPLRGWRNELFGRLALQLCRGEIALTLKDSEFRIINLECQPLRS